MRSKNLGILLVGLVLCAAAMRGCFSQGGATSPVRIEFWTLALSPFEAFIRDRIGAFQRLHPGVEVVWVDVPFEAIDRKLSAAAAARRAPDVVNLSDRTFGRFAGLGATVDFRPLLPFRPEDRYLEGALSIGRFGGRLLALPWYLTTQVGMVNEELLAAGGLQPSQLALHWTDLRRQAADYHDRTGKFLFSLPLGEESQLPIIMWGEGLRPLVSGADGRLVSNLLDPTVSGYIRDWVEFYRSGAMPSEAATRDHSHLNEMYQNRELAEIDSGPNFLKRVADVAPGVYQHTVARSPVTGATGKSHIATMVVTVTKQSRNPALAAEFSAFITSPESQTEFCRLAPILPSTPESLGSDVFARPPVGPDGRPTDKVAWARAVAAESLRDAVAFTPAMECWPDLRRAFEERLKLLLLDGGDVGAALKELDQTWNRILRDSSPATEDCLPKIGEQRERP